MNIFFFILLLITSIIIGLNSAYFSVVGVSQLFKGSLFITIMMACLEFAKFTTIVFLHFYWKNISPILKTYLLTAVIILMSITSIGVYGYLTKEYSDVLLEYQTIKDQENLYNIKIDFFEKEKNNILQQIELYRTEQQNLLKIISNRNVVIDSVIMQQRISNTNRLLISQERLTEQRNQINEDIKNLTLRLFAVNDSIYFYEQLKVQNTMTNKFSKLVPLEYVAQKLNIPFTTVLNILLIFLVITLDPLAVFLLISADFILKNKILQTSTKATEENLITHNIEEVTVDKDFFEKTTLINFNKELLLYLLTIFYETMTTNNRISLVKFKEKVLKNKPNISNNDIRYFILLCYIKKIFVVQDKIAIVTKTFEEAKQILDLK